MSSQPPGILLVGNYSNKTGYAWHNIHRLFSAIARDLSARDFRVCVSFAEIEPPVDCLPADLDIEILKYDPYQRSIGALFSLLRLLRRHSIQAVYWTDQRASRLTYGAMRLAGVRTIVVHSRASVSRVPQALGESTSRQGKNALTAQPDSIKPIARGLTAAKHLIKGWIARLRPFSADRVYAVSDFVRDHHLDVVRLDPDRVVTIHNGIDLRRFSPDEQLNDPEGPFRIFLSGRATREKGVDVVIQALALQRETFQKFGVVVEFAGDGPDNAEFRKLVATEGLDEIFLFLGEVPDTAPWVRRAKIIIVPSTWSDAFPSAVSEALAAGKPLVTTRVGGIPQMVGDEANAVLLEAGDPEALASALVELIEHPLLREQLGRNGRARAEEAFDEDLYHQAVIRQIRTDCEGVSSIALGR